MCVSPCPRKLSGLLSMDYGFIPQAYNYLIQAVSSLRLRESMFHKNPKRYRSPRDGKLNKRRRKEEIFLFQNQKKRLKEKMLCEVYYLTADFISSRRYLRVNIYIYIY